MKHILGNWKMHGSAEDLWAWQEAFKPPVDVQCGLFLPHTLLHSQPVNFFTGAQDVSIHPGHGAFTGEISAEMVKGTGARMALAGHSERRHIICESNEMVKTKAENAIRAGLTVVLCVGEPLEIREKDKQEEYVAKQLNESFPMGGNADNVIIAYEPVWAIGTGKVATLEEIAAMHAFIKGVAPAQNMAILYGGSVKAENARAILFTDNVDGVLVGGASLKADEFQKIGEAAL